MADYRVAFIGCGRPWRTPGATGFGMNNIHMLGYKAAPNCHVVALADIDPDEVVLTGAMAIWAYLAVFHYLHGRTRRIHYEDGVGNRVLVAAHG